MWCHVRSLHNRQAIKYTWPDTFLIILWISEDPGTWLWVWHSSSSACKKTNRWPKLWTSSSLQLLSSNCLPEAQYIFPHGIYPDYKVSDLPLSPQSLLTVFSAHPSPEPQVSLQLLCVTGFSTICVNIIRIIFTVVILPDSDHPLQVCKPVSPFFRAVTLKFVTETMWPSFFTLLKKLVTAAKPQLIKKVDHSNFSEMRIHSMSVRLEIIALLTAGSTTNVFTRY